MTFEKKLDQRIEQVKSCVSVGLDSDFAKIPEFFKEKYQSKQEAIFQFNKAIIDQTHDLVCAYKPNIAFYEAEGEEGLAALKQTVEYIKSIDASIITIVDAKRGDIGNTNQAYIQALFNKLQFDAVTVHPYLGRQALAPFLKQKDKGIIVLCRTSNPGADEFQDLAVDSKLGRVPLYQAVANQVAADWNQHNNCALVVGATYPKELSIVRTLVKDLPILIPGIGAQGGDVEKTVKAGQDEQGRGMIINSARSIIFASSQKDFAQIARQKTQKLKQLINKYR